MIIDTHCDTLSAIIQGIPFIGDNAKTTVQASRLETGGVLIQVFAIFAGAHGPSGAGKNSPAFRGEAQLQAVSQLKNAGLFQVDDPRDAIEGKVNFMLSIEGGEVFGTSLEKLHDFRKAGMRLCALTWNNENALGYPHCSNGHKSLKPFGREAVLEMNRLGIAVDVSHLGEGCFWDLIENNELPPMASHSCCRSICPVTRNLTDDQIRALIERKGWIGVNFYTRFLTLKENSSIEDVIRHIDHIVELGGIDHVGFGSDFDGIESAPVDLNNPGNFPNLISALSSHGYSSDEIAKITHLNFMEYMKQFSGENQ